MRLKSCLAALSLFTLLLLACAGDQAISTPTPVFPATPTATPTSTPPPSAAVSVRWEQVAGGGVAPGPRKDATLVYDEAGRRLWLFGGRAQGQPIAELWSFTIDRKEWQQVVTTGGPPGRWGHVAIFDGKRQQMVVFSGQSSSGFFNDTWVLDTASMRWQEAALSGAKPSTRYGSCAGYDTAGDMMYISHGFTNSGRFNDTWAFDLAARTWREVSAAGDRPIKRCLHRCSFDPQTSSLYLFGGQSNEVPILGDLWQFDPRTRRWTEVSSAGQKPSPRFFSALVEDHARQRLLLFGGISDQGQVGDLWAFATAGGWASLAPAGPAPSPRNSHVAAWDRLSQAMYLFGGTGPTELADLWRATF